MNVKIIEIEWSGPFKIESLPKDDYDIDFGLYQVYGTHNIFGPNSLLYIGKAEKQPLKKRLLQHSWVTDSESELDIYLGHLGGIGNVSEEDWEKDIRTAEELLIHFCTPPQNSSSINTIPKHDPVAILNHNKRHAIPRVISNLWYDCDYNNNYDNWNKFKLE